MSKEQKGGGQPPLFTRKGLEKKGLVLKNPPGQFILEIPSSFDWSNQTIDDKAAVLRIFGFVGDRGITSLMEEDKQNGKFAFQITQPAQSTDIPEPDEFSLGDLADRTGIETDMGKFALVEAIKNVQLLDRKHKDYGPGNISKFGLKGCLVRGSDKLERVMNLTENVSKPEFESVEDNLRDWSNYGLIALLCMQGKWK